MPMSPYALDGISANGLRWKADINLQGQPKRLADEDSLVVGDCITIRDSIAGSVGIWLAAFAGRPTFTRNALADIELKVDDLKQCADDPDDLSHALEGLYDTFDYHRICVVG